MVTMRVLAVLQIAALATSSCIGDRGKVAATESDCRALAEKGRLDERCAIEIARAEIQKREGDLTIVETDVHFSSEDHRWIVMAIYDPALPGGHFFVGVRLDGSIVDYEKGM